MSSVKIRLPLFAILAYVVQVTYGLSNYQFWIFLAVGCALMFIATGLSHSDEMPAGEAAEKGAQTVKKKVKEIKSHFASPTTGEDLDTEAMKPVTEDQQTIQFKTILVDAVNTLVTQKGEINKELFELLETYPNHKIIVTNADTTQMDTFGLNEMPYDVFTLQHKPNKPDPIYFATLMESFSLKADNIIYFEHNLEAVLSAQSVGITSYHYDHTKKDLATLKAFLDTNT